MHPDEAALLKAVCATPDDDLPRLVYADWLDENGRGTRAEFIRTKVEWARLEEWFHKLVTREERKQHGSEFRRLSFLRKRERWLRKNHPLEATDLPPAVLDRNPCQTHRGFVRVVFVRPTSLRDVNSWLESWPGPQPDLILDNVGPILQAGGPNGPFQYHALWSAAYEVELWDLYRGTESANQIALERLQTYVALPFPQLQTLDLSQGDLGDDGVRIVAEGFRSSNALQAVRLYDNGISTEGVRHLCRAKFADQLTELSLSGNPIHPDAVELICERRFPKLKTLRLRYTHMHPGHHDLVQRFEETYPEAALDV